MEGAMTQWGSWGSWGSYCCILNSCHMTLDKASRGIVLQTYFCYHRNMDTQQPDIAHIMTLIGEPARATILLALLSGEALPAGELARRCQLTPQTISSHLAKLTGDELLVVRPQGRHRYYQL